MLHTHNQESSFTHVCMHTFINMYIQTLYMCIHYITNMHARSCTHAHTHTHTNTHGPKIALSNVTLQTGGLRAIHWNGRNLF